MSNTNVEAEISIDRVLANGRWEFNEEVTRVFDNMLKRSIPQYEIMRELCFVLGCKFVVYKTDIVDLGCSRGEALAPFVKKYGAHNRFVGVEVSQPMLDASEERFKGMIEAGVVSIKPMDLRHVYPDVRSSLTLCILTLQFIPVEYRARILSDIYKSLEPGGAFIIVEKILESSSVLNELLIQTYLDYKRDNEYAEEELLRKKASLEGVLVPLTASGNEELMYGAGFDSVSMFWRYLNFAGWIAIK